MAESRKSALKSYGASRQLIPHWVMIGGLGAIDLG